jgi:hypothetical protein
MFWVKPITTCHQFASMHPILTYSSDQTPNSETTNAGVFFYKRGSFCFAWFKTNLIGNQNKPIIDKITVFFFYQK